jgi:hypothetical protein
VRIAILIFGTVLALSTNAVAGWVFYYQQFGDWTVLCWRDLGTNSNTCTLSAPPATMGGSAPPNVIQVHEYAPGAFQVAITIRDIVKPNLPAYLRVDEQPIREAAVRDGLARWYGNEALEVLAWMSAGKRLVYRVQTAPDGLPRDVHVGLDQFRDALARYREVIRSHGLLSAN